MEAEVTAEDEAEAKKTAVAATLERLGGVRPSRALPMWNIAITRRWDSREHG